MEGRERREWKGGPTCRDEEPGLRLGLVIDKITLFSRFDRAKTFTVIPNLQLRTVKSLSLCGYIDRSTP